MSRMYSTKCIRSSDTVLLLKEEKMSTTIAGASIHIYRSSNENVSIESDEWLERETYENCSERAAKANYDLVVDAREHQWASLRLMKGQIDRCN